MTSLFPLLETRVNGVATRHLQILGNGLRIALGAESAILLELRTRLTRLPAITSAPIVSASLHPQTTSSGHGAPGLASSAVVARVRRPLPLSSWLHACGRRSRAGLSYFFSPHGS